MGVKQITGEFFGTDIANIALSTEDATDSDIVPIPDGVDEIQVQGFGDVTPAADTVDAVFKFKRSHDGVSFGTNQTIHRVAQDVLAFAGDWQRITVKGIRAIQIDAVENENGVSAITDVNCRFAYLVQT